MSEPAPITQREHDLAELRAFLFNVERMERTIDALLRERSWRLSVSVETSESASREAFVEADERQQDGL